MDEEGFRCYLEAHVDPTYTPKSIRSRMSRARRVNKLLGPILGNFDFIVADDSRMEQARQHLRKQLDRADDYYNAVTRYYGFRRGHETPRFARPRA